MSELKNCFHCQMPISNLTEMMPWFTQDCKIHQWFHFKCFLTYVDDNIMRDIQMNDAINEKAAREGN